VSVMAHRPLRLLVASDKYKGSLSGPEACAAIAAGMREALGAESVEIRQLPVADGGEGMARSITEAKGGEWIKERVDDPLGRPVLAGYGLFDDGGGPTAVMEMAEASGLWRLSPAERDPWRATTRGTGQLMRRAIESGAGRILLGIGGSATNDGGVGLAEALGVAFLDGEGRMVRDLPAGLASVRRIDRTGAIPLPPVIVACDVTNPLLGPDGCTRIYGPQKGVEDTDLGRHEERLRHLVTLAGERGESAAQVSGSGAAGGLGFGCLVFAGASLRPGFALVAEVLGLEPEIAWADVVITGEGRLDAQTLQGKAPAGVADLARRLGKPVVAFAGIVEETAREVLAERFDFFAPLDAGGRSVSESMRQAAALLRATAARHAARVAGLAG
jgi:glycerate kinase